MIFCEYQDPLFKASKFVVEYEPTSGIYTVQEFMYGKPCKNRMFRQELTIDEYTSFVKSIKSNYEQVRPYTND